MVQRGAICLSPGVQIRLAWVPLSSRRPHPLLPVWRGSRKRGFSAIRENTRRSAGISCILRPGEAMWESWRRSVEVRCILLKGILLTKWLEGRILSLMEPLPGTVRRNIRTSMIQIQPVQEAVRAAVRVAVRKRILAKKNWHIWKRCWKDRKTRKRRALISKPMWRKLENCQMELWP